MEIENNDLFYDVRYMVNLYDLGELMDYMLDDAYDSEVEEIIKDGYMLNCPHKLAGIIEMIFDESFDGDYNHKKVMDMSKDLLKIFLEYRENNGIDKTKNGNIIIGDYEGIELYDEKYVKQLQNTVKELVNFITDLGQYKGSNIMALDEYLRLANKDNKEE